MQRKAEEVVSDLPKWPWLLVIGKRITPEQADKVIVRTSHLYGLECNDPKWNKAIKSAFGLEKKVRELKRAGANKLWSLEFEAWHRIGEDLGVLDLEYLDNDRISSTYVGGPHGWVNWDGTIQSHGMSLASKWPKVGEVTDEWRTIAHAFPFLGLTAQLVRDPYAGDDGKIAFEPLATWTVRNGAAELHGTPGDLICQPVDEDVDTQVRRMTRPRSECGVNERRLRDAIRRCARR